MPTNLDTMTKAQLAELGESLGLTVAAIDHGHRGHERTAQLRERVRAAQAGELRTFDPWPGYPGPDSHCHCAGVAPLCSKCAGR